MTDEQIVLLMIKLKSIPANRWFKLTGREDSADILQVVKLLIIMYWNGHEEHEFIISNDYNNFKRKVEVKTLQKYHTMAILPADLTIKKEKAKRNYVWEQQHEFIYHIYRGDVCIATETS